MRSGDLLAETSGTDTAHAFPAVDADRSGGFLHYASGAVAIVCGDTIAVAAASSEAAGTIADIG